MPKPDAGYITRLESHLIGVWSETWADWTEIDTFINGTFNLWPTGDKRPEYHPPTAAAKLDQAVAIQLPQKPKVHRFGKDKSQKEENKADVVERWVENLLESAALFEPHPTVAQAKRHLMAYGYTVVEGPALDAVALSQHEAEEPDAREYDDERQHETALRRWRQAKQNWNPIRIRAPHPRTILLHPELKQPREALKAVSRFQGDVWNLLKRKIAEGLSDVHQIEFDPQHDDYYQQIKIKEYWSEDWHAMLGASDELLYVEHNGWGFLPYGHAFSGWGLMRTEEDRINPVNMAVGLFTKQVREALKMQAQSRSGEHNAMQEAAWYQYGYSGKDMPPEQAARVRARGSLMTGKKEDWWVAEMPALAQWLFEASGKTDEDIENGTFSKGLGGFRRPGVTTVGQEAILDTRGDKQFDVPSGQLDHLFTIVAQNSCRLVEVVNEKITIRDTTIGPEDIQGNYAVEVTFQRKDDIMLAQAKTTGLQEQKQGLIDPETYLTDTGRENANEILRKVSIYKMLGSEQVQGTIIAAAAAEFQRRVAMQQGTGLLGPNGQPIQTQPPMQPPVQQSAMSPALQAMQGVQGGVDQRGAVNGQIAGITNAYAAQ